MSNEVVDQFCDPKNPRTINIEDVLRAREKLRVHIKYTPCRPSLHKEDFNMNLYYKIETQQKTGSFKERGILYALLQLTEQKRKQGVIIASLGNEALALCYHGEILKLSYTVVMPSCVSISKIQKCLNLGANVVVRGSNIMEAQKHAQEIARSRKLTYINRGNVRAIGFASTNFVTMFLSLSRDYPDVLNGYGTIALEILEQVPLVKAIIVPVGSGGLAAAVSSVIKNVKPNCLVYGVQTEIMPAFFKSLDSGKATVVPMEPTLADSIATPYVGVNALCNAAKWLDKMLLVNEDWIARAILHLAEEERLVVEGAGACPLAAIIGELVPELKSKDVVCVLSGGNVDTFLFSRYLEMGKAGEGRLMKFRVKLNSSTAEQAKLFRLLADNGYDVLQQTPEYRWIDDDESYYLELTLLCEARDLEHALDLKRAVEKVYPFTSFFETNPFKDKRSCACYIRELE